MLNYVFVWIVLKITFQLILTFSSGSCGSWDMQVLFSGKTTLKLGLMKLFTHLKIILLQYFQFSAISGIQTHPI